MSPHRLPSSKTEKHSSSNCDVDGFTCLVGSTCWASCSLIGSWCTLYSHGVLIKCPKNTHAASYF